ncbi:hypothetical protein P8452_06682 [Trifolium repens]|nr:hypothetical protein P8452_06682 [Trifolium repens]
MFLFLVLGLAGGVAVAGRWRRRWDVLLGALLAVAGSAVWVVRFFTHCFGCFCWWRMVLLVGGGGDDGRGLGCYVVGSVGCCFRGGSECCL